MSNRVKRKKQNKRIMPAFRNNRVLFFWKKNWIYPASFLFTVTVLTILYAIRSVYPFGDRAYLRMDFYHQYAPFLREFYDRVHNGKSLLFAWQNGMGLNFLALYAYYLASPFNWLILLWPREGLLEAANFYLVLKGGLASLSLTCVLSRKFKTKSFAVPFFGCIYGLSGFFLAYSCNIIWMDVYFLAPLVLWGVERIAKGKGTEVYLFSMAACAFSNFYLAFILGICCVFYFIINLIDKRRQNAAGIFKAAGKFIFATLVAVCIAAVLLLPAALALGNTPSSDAQFPSKWESYFHFYEMIVRFAMNSESIQNNSDLPNIYCSVLCILLLPLFMCNKKIRLRKKISLSILIAFLLASFEWNIPDYVWHGLHFPNSFPARQSFFLIFLFIIMGFETFHKRAGIPKPCFLIISALEIAGFAAGYFFLGKNQGKEGVLIYLCTIIWVGIYGITFLLENNFKKIIFQVLFGVILCGELIINTMSTGIKSTVSREAYLKKDAVTDELLLYLNETDGDGFYRVEELDRKAVNDGAWDGYRSVSCFSSTIPGGMKDFYEAFGHRTSNVSYSFQGETSLTTALFGIKYVFAEKEYPLGINYEESVKTFHSGKVYLYENKNALPLGFVVDENLENRIDISEKRKPFYTQNTFAKAVLEDSEAELYSGLAKEVVNSEDKFILEAGAEQAQKMKKGKPIKFSVPAGRQAFLYTISYVDEIKVTTFTGQDITGKTETYDDLKFRRIIDLGLCKENRVILVESDELKDSVNFYADMVNQDVLERVIERLGREPLKVTEYTERTVKGRVFSENGGVLFTSIPYDKGWKVRVDGVRTETSAFKGAFLSFTLPEGEHIIEMKYTPPGFYMGIVLSVAGLLTALGMIALKKNKCLKKYLRKNKKVLREE